MNSIEVFNNIKKLSEELYTLTAENDANVTSIKILCVNILYEIDRLKEGTVSSHVIMTKIQAKEYINKGLTEIIKYNDKVVLRSLGNFTDVIKPIRAVLDLLKNLNY